MKKLMTLQNNEKDLWKKYVKKHKNSGVQHTIEFMESIENAYSNCKPNYFFSQSKDIEALFPFFLVKSKILGNRLISVPFLDVGGFFGKYTVGDIKKIVDNFKQSMENIRSIEIRTNNSFKDFNKIRKILLANNFKEKKYKQQLIIALTSKEDFWKRFHKHTRNDIRKSKKSKLVLKKINDESEIKKFHWLYSREMKHFGTPQHSLKFFKNIFQFMGKKSVGFNCYKDKKMIGSTIMIYNNKSGYIAFNISDIKYRNFRPNDLLYWETIKWAMNAGLKSLDLGQVDPDSSDSRAIGLYKFKRKWLGKIYQRFYFYYFFNKEEENVQTKKDKLKKFRGVWKKLPLTVTKIFGPNIAAQLGT